MRKIYFYNTLTKKKDEFIPLKKGKVGMYVCGITPYDFTHLGHARCYVVFDAVRRFLKYAGYNVKYVQNFTDIDDKIIARSKEENRPWDEISASYIDEYYQDIRRLAVGDADVSVRVSSHIPDIINAVRTLQEKDFAYEIDGSIYYRVNRFPDYGKLSGRNPGELKPGSRVEVDKKKESPLDFALWKKSEAGEPCWESPWGSGRPGWHIECSVMSMKYIGETLDIHGGGQDLVFPHHENEIAQSASLTGKTFSRFWLHNGFVTINKEKMSKSLGNFFTLRDIYKDFSPQTVRFFLLSQHYRSPVDFSPDNLRDAGRSLERVNRIFEVTPLVESSGKIEKSADEIFNKFIEALCDDFNTSSAFSHFFALVKLFNRTRAKIVLEKLEETDKILGFLHLEKKQKVLKVSEKEILGKIKEREEARKSKNYKEADRIRTELLEKGVCLEDTSEGTKWSAEE
ncbi:MAG: cysteine--tRNA ligase [bacterium]